ncbi:MAG: UDP-N-acetylglucosamine diphosphorylase [Verrucomicrobia bacterium]|nr:UDP-N-acetylglucosamine diphosphorylase [Verrucomicrobiota bacterium]MBU6446237.1 UDP-N-acetylglucosamine diphosphorylase [Verrucomicrobiota bacterium]MDE3046915.1 UDP-N-acetylglucosamine diphosphorylase [Verrucomicrobiota bacterium]
MNLFFPLLGPPILSTFPQELKKRNTYLYINKYSYTCVGNSGYTGNVIDTADYFSLDDFEHRSLWKEGAPIWSALVSLSSYLDLYPFRVEIEIPQGIFIQNPSLVAIGKGTVIEPGVMIIGPCIIGKDCVIRHGAYIREEVILGDGCHIGHSAELKHSILLNRAAATHFVYVGDSIVGTSANLGAGVKCANLRLDRREVSVSVEGKRRNTGLKKFGAIVGDRTQIGCNCVLNPGTLIGKESFSHPLTNLRGTIPSRSQIDAKGVRPIEQKILEKLLWQSSASSPK